MGGNNPWKPETKEDIYRVGTSNISDSRISEGISLGGCHGCEGIWEGCTKGNESNSSDSWLNTKNASKEVREFTNDSSNKTNHDKGDNEASPSAKILWWRNESEDKFPTNADQMEETVNWVDILDLTIFILLWVKHASLNELGAPCSLFFIFDFLEDLVKNFLLLLGLLISDDINELKRFLTQFSTSRSNVRELDSESLIPNFLLVVQNFNSNSLFSFAVFESKSSRGIDEVSSGSSGLLRLIKLDGLVVNSDDTVTSILSDYLDFKWLSWDSSDGSLLVEGNLTWLIIINNCDSSSSIFAHKFFICISINKLDEEIFIWLPIVVIVDLDNNMALLLSLLELDDFIDSFIIITSFGFLINSLNSNLSTCSSFVDDVNHDRSRGLRNGIVETLETEKLMLLFLINMFSLGKLLL